VTRAMSSAAGIGVSDARRVLAYNMKRMVWLAAQTVPV
jgi:hypothetical protein